MNEPRLTASAQEPLSFQERYGPRMELASSLGLLGTGVFALAIVVAWLKPWTLWGLLLLSLPALLRTAYFLRYPGPSGVSSRWRLGKLYFSSFGATILIVLTALASGGITYALGIVLGSGLHSRIPIYVGVAVAFVVAYIIVRIAWFRRR